MKDINKSLIIPIILFIFFNACDKTLVEEYETCFNVFSILKNFNYIHEVTVDRTYKMDEPSERCLDDALVILSGPDFVDTLKFYNTSGSYLSDWHELYPLTTYELIVVKENFDTLFAQTKMPGNFEIVIPKPGDTLSMLDTIVFRKSAGAAYYYGYFIQPEQNTEIPFWIEPDTLDSLLCIPINDYLSYIPSGSYTILIVACDRNCHKYYLEDDEDSLIQAGVESGVGLFGSTWTEITDAYIITE